MEQRHYLLKGTVLLTAAGVAARGVGFFYKIFLSRTIGAAEIGRFQLTMPVYAFCMALAGGGIQTAISRFTAEYYAKKEERAALRVLLCALLLSGGLSVACSAALFFGASWIASSFLLEPSCALLLKIIAFSLPFSAVHGCVNGFFIGRKEVAVSAASQLVEQLLRIASAVLFCVLSQKSGRTMDGSVMALGQIAGELAAALFCAYHLIFGGCAKSSDSSAARHTVKADARSSCAAAPQKLYSLLRRETKKVFSVSAPLGVNRMLICVLQGIEAALLPQMLGQFGHSASDALASYGTLTGMALPLLMFPTAVTGSLGTLLLPAVSEARALGRGKKIAGTVSASFHGSLLLGYFFLTAFLLFGDDAGQLLFHSALAGAYTRRLAPVCPFLYVNTTLISILHGLGKTAAASAWNVAAFCIRLYFIVFLVPDVGIDGYFLGMLLSQAFVTSCALFVLHRQTHFKASLSDTVLRPALICIVSGAALKIIRFLHTSSGASLPVLLLFVFLYAALFLTLAALLLLNRQERTRLLHAFRVRMRAGHR